MHGRENAITKGGKFNILGKCRGKSVWGGGNRTVRDGLFYAVRPEAVKGRLTGADKGRACIERGLVRSAKARFFQ
jgi:hypothetical protein